MFTMSSWFTRDLCVGLYNRTLKEATQLPAGVSYRVAVEANATEGLQALQSSVSDDAVEQSIGRGQLEELIQQAEDELGLLADMAAWKPWEGDPPPPAPLSLLAWAVHRTQIAH